MACSPRPVELKGRQCRDLPLAEHPSTTAAPTAHHDCASLLLPLFQLCARRWTSLSCAAGGVPALGERPRVPRRQAQGGDSEASRGR